MRLYGFRCFSDEFLALNQQNIVALSRNPIIDSNQPIALCVNRVGRERSNASGMLIRGNELASCGLQSLRG